MLNVKSVHQMKTGKNKLWRKRKKQQQQQILVPDSSHLAFSFMRFWFLINKSECERSRGSIPDVLQEQNTQRKQRKRSAFLVFISEQFIRKDVHQTTAACSQSSVTGKKVSSSLEIVLHLGSVSVRPRQNATPVFSD